MLKNLNKSKKKQSGKRMEKESILLVCIVLTIFDPSWKKKEDRKVLYKLLHTRAKNSIIDIRIYLPVNSSIFATLDPGFV